MDEYRVRARPRSAIGADCGLALSCDRAHRLRGFGERGERDVVGVGIRLLVARHRADADAAIDVERARLHDALLEAPALEARVLEVQVGEVDVVRMDLGEHARERMVVEARRRQQQVLGVGEDGFGDRGNRHVGHRGAFEAQKACKTIFWGRNARFQTCAAAAPR